MLDELIRLAHDPEVRRESPTKNFLARLMPERVELDSIYVRPALEPRVIGLANAYIGMRTLLRSIDIWLNIATDEPAKASQLWHRDYDDYRNVKIFVYLSDVTEDRGPFTFAPGTHPGGPRQLGARGQLDGDAMAALVSKDDWLVCSGPAGTTVICDTGGYHRGGKPLVGERLLWTAQYTSGAPFAPRSFELALDGGMAALTPDQRYAVLEHPRRRS
jgi:hypothetical protein